MHICVLPESLLHLKYEMPEVTKQLYYRFLLSASSFTLFSSGSSLMILPLPMFLRLFLTFVATPALLMPKEVIERGGAVNLCFGVQRKK